VRYVFLVSNLKTVPRPGSINDHLAREALETTNVIFLVIGHRQMPGECGIVVKRISQFADRSRLGGEGLTYRQYDAKAEGSLWTLDPTWEAEERRKPHAAIEGNLYTEGAWKAETHLDCA
jgi:hypothetical protein